MTSFEHAEREPGSSPADAAEERAPGDGASMSSIGRGSTLPLAKGHAIAEAGSRIDPVAKESVFLQDLYARNASARTQLSAVCGSSSEDDLMRIVSMALASQHADGSWGSEDYPIMKACFTAQILDALHYAGMTRAAGPSVNSNPPAAQIQIVRALSWLREHQQSSGKWGEDAWDTCQVLKALLKYSHRDDPVIAAGLSYLRDTVNNGWPDQQTFWFGPGFMGGALEVFNAVGDSTHAKIVFDEMWRYFDKSTGRFLPPATSPDSPRAPVEWHTANALKGLTSYGSVTPGGERTSAALKWLRGVQADNGSWGPGHFEITAFCTFEVAMALSVHNGSESREVGRAVQWFIAECVESKSNLSTLLMAAMTIIRTRRHQLVAAVDFVFMYELLELLASYSGITASLASQGDSLRGNLAAAKSAMLLAQKDTASTIEKLHQAETTIASLQHEVRHKGVEVESLQNRIQGYALRMTGNQLAVLGIALTIITFVVGLIVAMALAGK